MTSPRTLGLLVVIAHWIVAVTHLFLAARVLPAPNSVSWLAIILITCGHLCVAVGLWKLSNKFAGAVSLIFFLAALGADLYEHFLHPAANNIFTMAAGDWTAWFDASVFGLRDLVAFDRQLHVIADTAAEGAGGILDDFQFGHTGLESFPTGKRNVQFACRFLAPSPA